MTLSFLVLPVVVAVQLAGAAGDTRPSENVPPAADRPATATPTAAVPGGRMFPLDSGQAWPLVQQQLKILGLSFDEVDRTNQAVLTKWQPVKSKELAWLPPAGLPEPYLAERVRFVVFVSPFAEPARVYVGTQVEARKVSVPPSGPATVYGVRPFEQALLAQLASALGHGGFPVPADQRERRRLAREILGDRSGDCLRPDWSLPRDAQVEKASEIPLSEFKLLYPPAAKLDKVEGVVRAEFTILEDGGVTDIHLVGPPLGRQLEAAALGALSLLLYRPARFGACGIPTHVTYETHFNLR